MSSSSPASQVEATEALRALFTAFPSDKGPVNGFAATFLMAVEGYSQQAIRKAVTRLIRGEFDWFDGRFLPTPAQVSRACKYCEDLIAPPKRLALPAPGDVEPTEDSKRRVADMARNWSDRAVPSPYDEYDAWQKSRAEIPSGLPHGAEGRNKGERAA